ncbi:MAG: PD-(D/E)XK nuclease-like domain-containing protein [Myxococcota bacterium]
MREFVDFATHDWTMAEYLAAPALSRSDLVGVVRDVKPFGKDAAKFGEAVHMALLEPDVFEQVAVREPRSWDPPGDEYEGDRWDQRLAVKPKFGGTGARLRAKQWEEEQEKAGLTVATPSAYAKAKRDLFAADTEDKLSLSRTQWDHMWGCVAALKRIKLGGVELGTILEKGDVSLESSITFTDKATGLRCKQRRDIVLGHVFDVKTASDPDESAFERAIGDRGYDVQGSFYGDAEAQYRGVDDVAFVNLVVGKQPQKDGLHRTAIYELGENWRDLGRSLYESALDIAAVFRGRDGLVPLYWSAEPRLLNTPPLWHAEEAERIKQHANEVRANG